MKQRKHYFTRFEITLFFSSVFLISAGYFLFDRSSLLMPAASIIGVASLLFAAKGNPIAQGLMILFSLLYCYISYTFSYWGEMITYAGMTMPMAVISLISWLRHPFQGNHAQVQVHRLTKADLFIGAALTVAVTFVFYWILKALKTPNLAPSTLSIFTSFAAVYLTFRRSPYFALAYAANDLVLIVLWSLAAFTQRSYLSVVFCFTAFLANDLYGFINWIRMHRHQKEAEAQALIPETTI